MALKISHFSTIEGFALHKKEWKSLESEVKTFVNFDFNSLLFWWQNTKDLNYKRLGLRRELIVLLIHQSDRLVGVLPLIKIFRKKKFIEYASIEFLNQPFGGPLMDIIEIGTLTSNDIKQIIDYLYNNFKFERIYLAYLPETSKFLTAFPEQKFVHSGFLEISVEDDYELIKKNYSRNLRHNIKKDNNKLLKYPDEILPKIILDKKEISSYKDKIAEVSNTKLSEIGMHSHYQNEAFKEFNYNFYLNNEKICLMAFEDLSKNILVSFVKGIIHHDTIYLTDASYNRDYKEFQNLGFGILAIDELIKHFSQKFKKINFGIGLSQYKFRFTKNVHFTYMIYLPGNNLTGKIINFSDRKMLNEIELSLSQKVNAGIRDKTIAISKGKINVK